MVEVPKEKLKQCIWWMHCAGTYGDLYCRDRQCGCPACKCYSEMLELAGEGEKK